jgi:hypothetical protein
MIDAGNEALAMRRRFLLGLVAAGLAAAGAAAATGDGVSAADAKAVREVVQAQLDAFAADDAPRAFSYAGPGIRRMFGTADRFLALVKASYPVVYRPASVAFLVPEAVGDKVIQGVHFTDAAGRLWLALYRLQRQGSDGWRIDGCQLVESRARTT